MPFGAGPRPRMTKKQYRDAQIELASKVVLLSVDAEFARLPSVDEIIREASRQITEWRDTGSGKNVGLVIDPWNEMDHARPGNMSETEYISQTLSIVRQFARDWDIHVWLVAHPTKLQKDKDGKYQICRLWDISGSAHWNNKADNGITVHRDYETGTTTIYVLKVRFKHVGKPGACDLIYDRVTGRYTDPNGLQTTYRESECPI
jgi:twinkle protein